MTQEQFEHITANCQPHKVFYNDWSQYYSDDFADSLLPNAGMLKGEAFRLYDGAELTPKHNRFVKHLLPLTSDGKTLRLTMFSYPQGVKAEEKKTCVKPGRDEVCVFFEINEEDSINVFIRFGALFKECLQSFAKRNHRKDVTSLIESETFITDFSCFQVFFKDEISHYRVFSFLGGLMGIDLEEVSEKSKPMVHITNVGAYTSEPCGNKNRKKPEKQRKQLRVDFNIKEKTVTQYGITVLWKDEILYEMGFIPEMKITPYVKTESEKAVFTQEKQTVYWDCTEFMGILTRTERITVRIVAKDSDGNTSLSERIVNPGDMFKKPGKNNYIVVLDADNNEHIVYGDDIIRRQESFIERIPKAVYDTLSDTHKLVLHLPEIMVKLDWIHGALCQIHWLEGSGKSLKFPYEFFMSEKRVEDFDVKNLREYFKGIRYLSFENLGYSPSNPDGENIFLYNDTSKLPIILESLKLFHENLSKREDCGPVGGNERFKTERSETESFVNENLFLSYSIGYEDGDFDDIGAALGKYAMRCYYQGWLDKNYQLGQWVLNVESVKCRFFDDFNFDDDKKVWWKPLTWFSQMLGTWKEDHNNVEKPVRFYLKSLLKRGNWEKLNNKAFRDLRTILQKELQNCCIDFYVFSSIKTIDNEFVKKNIIIRKEH